ncbi:unnamed protein product [Spirodela intermedia]|uniref:Uncharacterized protein n=1 Tax=Spirodela intermedia TaxID=51605 RepID=A0A7I8JJB8_SPIIN|nr:unnamed protein product [Spirodela intermedia]CAA6669663.1 unnamed protein product [Spirodela intermedia]
MEELLYREEEDNGWRCWRHRAAQQPTGGVCAVCVRERLLGLCPNCVMKRSLCKCSSSSSASSSSSLSSGSSLDVHRSGAGSHVGAVGRVSNLIVSEPAFHRSRSAGFRRLWPRSGVLEANAGDGEGGGRSSLWRIHGGKEENEKNASNVAAAMRVSRSRSVGAGAAKGADKSSGGEEVKSNGWNRYFPISFWALRRRKSSKVIQSRSPPAEAKLATDTQNYRKGLKNPR